MLLVKTTVGPSTIEGIGLFAAEFIARDTPCWEFVPEADQAKTDEEVAKLPAPAREFWDLYAYKSRLFGRWVLCGDHNRFMNHSSNPNIADSEEVKNGEAVAVAVRDIKKGEELTYDYRTFDEKIDFEVKA